MNSRKNLIDTAVKFLLNPKVQGSSEEQKRTFLSNKGLTDTEVQLALDRALAASGKLPPAPGNLVAPPVPQAPEHLQQPQSPVAGPWLLTGWRSPVVLFGLLFGAIAALYKLIQMYVVPLLRAREEQKQELSSISTSLRELRASVDQLQRAVDHSKEELASLQALQTSSDRTERQSVTELKAEFSSVKALMLNRNQFAPPPRLTPTIPAWQVQASNTSAEASASTEGTLLSEGVSAKSNSGVPEDVTSDGGPWSGCDTASVKDGDPGIDVLFEKDGQVTVAQDLDGKVPTTSDSSQNASIVGREPQKAEDSAQLLVGSSDLQTEARETAKSMTSQESHSSSEAMHVQINLPPQSDSSMSQLIGAHTSQEVPGTSPRSMTELISPRLASQNLGQTFDQQIIAGADSGRSSPNSVD